MATVMGPHPCRWTFRSTGENRFGDGKSQRSEIASQAHGRGFL